MLLRLLLPETIEKMPAFEEQLERARTADGFLAALDQSGGSTPKALRQYGIADDSYVEGETSMYDVIHAMRTRKPNLKNAEQGNS